MSSSTGILSALEVGLGYSGGTMLGGLLISYTGIRTTFRLYAALAVVSVILYNVQRVRSNSDDREPEYKAVPFTEKEEDGN